MPAVSKMPASRVGALKLSSLLHDCLGCEAQHSLHATGCTSPDYSTVAETNAVSALEVVIEPGDYSIPIVGDIWRAP